MIPISEYLDTIRVVYPSLVTAAALGISGGIVGAFVLLRREALLTLAMPQVVAVGAAIGLRMGWPSLAPALAAVIVAVLLLAWSRRQREGNWLLPALYIVVSVFFLYNILVGDPRNSGMGLVLSAAGLIGYAFWSRSRT